VCEAILLFEGSAELVPCPSLKLLPDKHPYDQEWHVMQETQNWISPIITYQYWQKLTLPLAFKTQGYTAEEHHSSQQE